MNGLSAGEPLGEQPVAEFLQWGEGIAIRGAAAQQQHIPAAMSKIDQSGGGEQNRKGPPVLCWMFMPTRVKMAL